MSTTIVQPRAEVYKPHDSVDANRLPIKENSPFTLVHYAGAWEWDDDVGDFLPCLSEIAHRPAVNGVGDDGRATRALGGAVAKGGTLIQPDDGRLGRWRNYIIRYATTNGRWHYCFTGTKFAILPGGQARPIDGSADYRAFRRHLIQAHVLAPIDAISYGQIIDATERRIDRISRRMHARPSELDSATRDALIDQLKRMKEWWAKNGAPLVMDTAPTPGEKVVEPETVAVETLSQAEIEAVAAARTGRGKSDGKLTLGGA